MNTTSTEIRYLKIMTDLIAKIKPRGPEGESALLRRFETATGDTRKWKCFAKYDSERNQVISTAEIVREILNNNKYEDDDFQIVPEFREFEIWDAENCETYAYLID